MVAHSVIGSIYIRDDEILDGSLLGVELFSMNMSPKSELFLFLNYPRDTQLKKYLIILYQEFAFSPNTNAIETINQSNEIRALNNELRTAILDYYALIERTKERVHISNTQIQTKYEPYLNKHYPNIFDKDNAWEFTTDYYKNDLRPTTTINSQKYLNDKTLETLLLSRYYQNNALENFYEN